MKNKISFSDLLIYFLLFLLPTQLGKHFFLGFSYINGLRVDYLAPAIYLTDILVVGLVLLYRKEIVEVIKKHSKIIALLFGFFIVNTFFSKEPVLSLYYGLRIFELFAVFIIFSKTRLSKQNIFRTLLLGGLMTLFLSLYQLSSTHSFQGIFYFLGERNINLSTPGVATIGFYGRELLRPYATFSHPNSLAGFYLLLYSLVLFSKLSKNILFYILHFTFAMLVFLSFSKIAIITLFFITMLYAIFERHGCLPCRVASIFIFLSVSLIFLQGSGDPESLSKRLVLNSDAITIIKSNLLWGVGMGQYVISQAKIPSNYPYFFMQPVHNIFFLLLAEAGILLSGIVFYLMSRFAWINRANKTFMACLLIVIFTGLFDHYWLTLQQNMLLLGVVFGLTASSQSQ